MKPLPSTSMPMPSKLVVMAGGAGPIRRLGADEAHTSREDGGSVVMPKGASIPGDGTGVGVAERPAYVMPAPFPLPGPFQGSVSMDTKSTWNGVETCLAWALSLPLMKSSVPKATRDATTRRETIRVSGRFMAALSILVPGRWLLNAAPDATSC